MALTLAAIAPPVQAIDPEAPLPPVGVSAVWTEAGTRVSWLPAVSAEEVTGYEVYRMDEAGLLSSWTFIGSTAGDVLELLDPANAPGTVALYYVAAANAEGTSAPSHPTAAGGDSQCPYYELALAPPQGPHFEPHPECIGVMKVRFSIGRP